MTPSYYSVAVAEHVLKVRDSSNALFGGLAQVNDILCTFLGFFLMTFASLEQGWCIAKVSNDTVPFCIMLIEFFFQCEPTHSILTLIQALCGLYTSGIERSH